MYRLRVVERLQGTEFFGKKICIMNSGQIDRDHTMCNMFSSIQNRIQSSNSTYNFKICSLLHLLQTLKALAFSIANNSSKCLGVTWYHFSSSVVAM
jgi:hypothetical protein